MAALWLRASVMAHDFIPAAYWVENLDAMRDTYLPVSENYVCTNSCGEILGFISLSDSGHIEALFVAPEHQGHGVGRALLDRAKRLYPVLTLAVYEENSRAVDFYLRNGFTVTERRIEPATGHPELLMKWRIAAGGGVPAGTPI